MVEKIRKTEQSWPVDERQKKRKKTKPDYKEIIQKAIEEDPTIEESSHISVNVVKGGLFKKGEIHLIGKVHKESDKQRAQELAEINSKKRMKVINGILIEK